MVRDLNIVCAIATSLCNSLHWICCKCSVYLWRKHTIDVALVGVFVMHIGIVAPWCQMSLKFNFVMIYEWLALLTALYIVGIPSYLWNTHTRFNGHFSGTTQVSRYQKGKTNLDFTGARDSEWQWHQLGHMQVCISLQTDNHASTPPLSFFTGRMPFLPPNQQRQSTECSSTEGRYLWNRQSFSFSRPIYKLFGWLIFLFIRISWTIFNFTIPWIHESVEALYWYRNKYDKY